MAREDDKRKIKVSFSQWNMTNQKLEYEQGFEVSAEGGTTDLIFGNLSFRVEIERAEGR
jgi:hypothetical protein|tara:strand:+ start:1942 stop:2118 length:177 start_codon:yes stop_codon:yes gene_type:complete